MPPENGYSPSSVADDFFGSVEKDLNQLDGNVADSPTGGTDFAESFAKEQDAKLSAAARWAKQFAPDDYAKAAKLTPGVPPEIGVRQMSEIENLDKINQYHEIFKKSPQLGGYFVDNPKDLAFANPDELDKISGINWAIQAGPAAFSAGIDQTRLGYLLYSQVAGTATEEEIAEADRLSAIPQRTFGNHGDWLSSGLVGAAQTLPQMGASVVGALVRGIQFGAPASVAGFAAGGPAGAVAGAGGGFTVGAAYGNVEQQIKIQTGLAYNEFRNFRDETGAPLDPTVAKWASLFAGIGGGGLESLGISATLGKVPGMKNLVGMFSTQGMKTALRNPTIRTAFTNFAKNLGEGVAVETLTEMGQEGLTVLAGEIAKSTSGQDFEMLTSAEVIARVAESGKQALQVMTLLGPVTSGTRFAADLKDMKDSKVAHDNLLRAATALEENGLIKRSPEVAQRVIDQVAGDQKVYIPAKDMAELFQTEERDLMAVAIPNWRERVTEAIATNDDVELTMGEFMAHLGQDPKNNPLMELVRVDPRHYLPKDIKTFSDEMDDLMGSELVKAERRMGKLEDAVAGIQKDTRVKDILKEQITSTGFTADAAEAYAQTISAYVMTKAKQLNVDPVAWAEANGPLINRNVGPMDQTIRDANELDHRVELFQPAWHGTPHEFEQFSMDKIGTGEGAQAFGYGLYFAGDKSLAQAYQKKLSRNMSEVRIGSKAIDKNLVNAYLNFPSDFYDAKGNLSRSARNGRALRLEDTDLADMRKDVASDLAEIEKFRADPEAYRAKQEAKFPGIVTWKTIEGTEKALQQNYAIMRETMGDLELAIEHLRSPEPITKVFNKGRLFQVDLPESPELLMWDVALQDQTQEIKDKLATLGIFQKDPEVRAAEMRATERRMTLAEYDALPGLAFRPEGIPDDTIMYVYQPQGAGGAEYVYSMDVPADDETIMSWTFLEDLTGQDIYNQLKARFEKTTEDEGWTLIGGKTSTVDGKRADQLASELLREAGIKGHKYLKGTARNYTNFFRVTFDPGFGPETKDFRTMKEAVDRFTDDGYLPHEYTIEPIDIPVEEFNYVIYDDTAVKVIEYFQDQRGSITFQQEGPALIKLFNKADMSTLLHEAGHFFLHTTREFAEKSPEIMKDWLIIKKHLKIGDDNRITREQHEQFAKWTEAFFMEGKTANPELRGAFAMFRMWLKTLYKSLTKLGGKVHPEIAAVFDNMLRADAAVEKQAQDTQYAPLNMTAEEMGVSPEDYLAYQRLAEELRSEAQDSIIGRVVGQQKKLQASWFKEIAAELRKEAEARLAKMPPYSHMPIMKESRFSIGTEAFGKKYSKAAMARFPRSAFKKDGLDPEVAANLLGYPTADEMVHDFMMAPPIKEAARIAAEQEMISRYGNDYQNQTILDLQVKRQLAAEGRTVLLGKELQILNRKAGAEVSEKAPRQLAQEIARRNIWTKKFKDVKEAKTHSLMGRMARMAENAIVKGKWQEAADFKRKQLLATAMDVETQRVNSVVEKIRDKAARYTKTTPKGIDPSSMEQIRDLVTRYEFAKVSGRKLERRASLGQYLEQMRQDGQTPIQIPDRLMRDQGKVNYKELTVEELLGFGDVLDNLEHMGRLKNKLRVAKNKREFAADKGRLIDSMSRRKDKPRKMKHFGEEKTEALDKLWQWTATLLKPEAIIEWLDLGDIAGPAMELLFNPIAEAQNLQNDMSAQYNERVMKIFENIDSAYLTEVVNISSLNATLTREKIYAIALNMGNLSNQRKLMEGYKFTEPQMAEILSHMSKKDWDNVQKIWDTLDTLWEKIAAMEKRLTGVAPPKVEAHEFTNQHGTYAGGYYPVIYDFKTPAGLNLDEDTRPIDQQSATYQQLFGGKPFIPPGTSHKHTYARQAVSKPIKLSLAVLPGHIHTVIHDLAYREPVRTAYKLLWDPDVKAKISAVESPHVYNQLTHWLHQVAAERPFADDPTAGFVDKLRIGATIYGMGFRFSTVAAQPLGLFNGAARVGSANLLAGLAQFIRHPKSSMDLVNSLSGEMKHRFNAQDRDIKATIQNAALHPDRLHRLAQYSLAPIGMIDKLTSVIVWLGGYSKAIRAGQAQDLAIQSADRDVRLTQGTGNAKDLAKIMSSGSLNRIFTMFYSAFSAQYNMGVDLTRSTKRDIDAGNIQALFLERLPQFLMLVAVPAVFGALITGQGPEEDEDKIWWAAKKIMLYPVAGVPFLRDVIGQAASGFDYKLSPAGKALDESTKALEKLFNSDLEWEERLTGALKPGLIATSSFLGLPTGQAINTIEGLYYGLQNDDLEFSDLLYGRRDKEK